jgi:glycosyltransferase involved in cell wall biosynthesis
MTRSDGDPPTVAYILRSYPRLSQTFIVNEIVGLERLGLRIRIFAMTDARERLVQDAVETIKARTEYLELGRVRGAAALVREHLELALTRPRRYAATAVYLWRRRNVDAGYATCSTRDCFLDAVHLAVILGRSDDRIRHVHAHFAHDPAFIALLVKKLTGVSYSFSAHARDLYQTQASVLGERIHEASSVVTCCRANLDYLRRLVSDGERRKLRLVRHGVDTRTFRPGASPRAALDVPLIVAVGRLVEKKGFVDLVHACRRVLDGGHDFGCEIYGEGPLLEALLGMVSDLGLTQHVSLRGARTQAQLVAALQRADLFALTPYVTSDGDRDGIPNVLLEAMACGLPPVTTAVGGIPEVVVHGHNGLLAAPRDVPSIAGHLAALLGDGARRERLGSRARRTVVEQFDDRRGAQELMGIFGELAGSDA